ncbi:nuclear transport factor 2 family protein [Dactylosporangium sp. CA-152071]|uniref:nuclear transport factor 2 family protein n=1 Tax=Dactylosporangium sp. CA-152071 TaxID=3239933 RepID=UPI003D90C8BB
MATPMLDATEHLALLNLYARYAHAIDDHDPRMIEACFTKDAEVIITYPRPEGPSEPVTRTGRSAIVEHMMAVSGSRPGYVHDTFNVHLERVDASTFIGRARWRVLDPLCRPESMGRYDDVITADGDAWRLRRRAVDYLWRRDWHWIVDSAATPTDAVGRVPGRP